MGKLNILDKTGDIKLEWNPEVEEEVEAAKKTFDDYKKMGFKAFRQYDEGKRGEELKNFDQYAEKILFIPPLKGGDATLASLR